MIYGVFLNEAQRCLAGSLPRGSKYTIFGISGAKTPYPKAFLGPKTLSIEYLDPLGWAELVHLR